MVPLASWIMHDITSVAGTAHLKRSGFFVLFLEIVCDHILLKTKKEKSFFFIKKVKRRGTTRPTGGAVSVAGVVLYVASEVSP